MLQAKQGYSAEKMIPTEPAASTRSSAVAAQVHAVTEPHTRPKCARIGLLPPRISTNDTTCTNQHPTHHTLGKVGTPQHATPLDRSQV